MIWGVFSYHITMIYLVDVNLSSLQCLNLGLIPRTYLWKQRWWFHTGLKAPCLSAHWHSITATGFLAKCCSVVPTGSTDVSLAVVAIAIFLPWQHLHSCVVGCHAQAGAPQPALELLTARGRSAQMAGGGVRGLAMGGGGWQVETGAPIWPRCWHSAPGHLQRLLDRKPVRSWKSPCAKRCTLWAVGGWGVGGWGDQTQQWELISPDSGRKRMGTN